jgi:small subunit ribosomal protein S8
MQTDPLADFLTIIRNANCAAKPEVTVSYSRLKSDVAHILKQEGYLSEVETVTTEKSKPQIKLKLRGSGKSRALTSLKRISKPGLRIYVGADDIPQVLGGMGISIISTSAGVMAGHQARKRRLGGELLLEAY